MYEPRDVLTREEEIRAIMGPARPMSASKVIDHIDEICAAWIAHAPFLTMATVSADGRVDVSPKGDPAGFVQVLDRHTLAIPDRPGNNRYDGFQNILETGRIGLMFMVPPKREVLRVNGHGWVVRDADLRERMAIKGRVPDFAVVLRVEEAFLHCGKAVIRSGLWAGGDIAGLPNYAQAIDTHGDTGKTVEEIEAILAHNDAKRLYDN